MPMFEVSIVCSDGQACCSFVKGYMDNFSEIVTGENHPYGHVAKTFAKDYREMIKIINELKKNAGGAIEDISLRAIEK